MIHSVSPQASAPAWRRAGLAAAALLLTSMAAHADPTNLIQNGTFTQTTATTADGTGTEISNSNLTGWNISGCLSNCDASNPNNTFTFLAPNNIGTNGVYNANQGGTIRFWSTPGAAPVGNAIAADAATEVGLLYQTVSGLKIGDTYTLTFYQASIQATTQSQPFSAAWEVGFGDSAAKYSTTMNNPGGGTTGWMQQTMTFTADAVKEALGFFAIVGGADEPPFLLLDGVSLTDTTAVPEPATYGLVMVGLAGLLLARRRRVSQ